MGDDSTTRTTRRTLLASTGTTLAATLLAGCTTDTDSTDTAAPTDAGGATNARTTTSDATDTTTTADGPYSVSMAPMGDVEFEQVPEDVFTVFSTYADMAVALGHGDALNSLYVPEMAGTTMNHYYSQLDGISFDFESLVDPLASGLSKEQLYELQSDVHLADPAWAATQQNWTDADVTEVQSRVGPWFGNFYSGTNNGVPDAARDYEFYGLWELFEKVAAVFQERERYEALAAVHDDLIATIEASRPPKSERPTAVRATLGPDGEQFYTYHLNEPGYWLADTRPLGATDAFADEDWSGLWGVVDYETMAEADPDVLLHLWGLTPNYSMADTKQSLREHPIGSELAAVENDRVYPAGMRYQGPIMNCFQLEMGAKQLYPDVFGAWPTYEDGRPYPEIPADERLFDRERVASIVRGDA
jgi:ABC-type Fe3+-hydroxamate transport system substrate-binding protein